MSALIVGNLHKKGWYKNISGAREVMENIIQGGRYPEKVLLWADPRALPATTISSFNYGEKGQLFLLPVLLR
jgi:hypothetical protein